MLARQHLSSIVSYFFFNDTATTEIYTLSLHDALPISSQRTRRKPCWPWRESQRIAWIPVCPVTPAAQDRKSTRLNSSHVEISYAVFCLKKKKKQNRCPEKRPKRNISHKYLHHYISSNY